MTIIHFNLININIIIIVIIKRFYIYRFIWMLYVYMCVYLYIYVWLGIIFKNFHSIKKSKSEQNEKQYFVSFYSTFYTNRNCWLFGFSGPSVVCTYVCLLDMISYSYIHLLAVVIFSLYFNKITYPLIWKVPATLHLTHLYFIE